MAWHPPGLPRPFCVAGQDWQGKAGTSPQDPTPAPINLNQHSRRAGLSPALSATTAGPDNLYLGSWVRMQAWQLNLLGVKLSLEEQAAPGKLSLTAC